MPTESMKHFYTGPLVNAELLVVMLEKHGIASNMVPIPDQGFDDGDLDQPTQVMVADSDYQRAWDLFYKEREDEL